MPNDEIKVNLDGVEPWASTAILPPGRHNVVISDVEVDNSRGDPRIVLQMDALDPAFSGHGVKDWITVNGKTLGRVRQVLEAAGVEIPEGEFSIPTAQLFDKRLTVFVVEEPYNGEMKTKVKGYQQLSTTDVPADTRGLPGPGDVPSARDKVPF